MSMDELDPHVARALTLAARFQSALDGTLNQMNNGSFRATDEAETVEVTINGHQWLTGLRIEDGLLKKWVPRRWLSGSTRRCTMRRPRRPRITTRRASS